MEKNTRHPHHIFQVSDIPTKTEDAVEKNTGRLLGVFRGLDGSQGLSQEASTAARQVTRIMESGISTARGTLGEHMIFDLRGQRKIPVLAELEDIHLFTEVKKRRELKATPLPLRVRPLLSKAAKLVVCGLDFAAVVDKDSNIFTFGRNYFGQCGVPASADFVYPPHRLRFRKDEGFRESEAKRETEKELQASDPQAWEQARADALMKKQEEERRAAEELEEEVGGYVEGRIVLRKIVGGGYVEGWWGELEEEVGPC